MAEDVCRSVLSIVINSLDKHFKFHLAILNNKAFTNLARAYREINEIILKDFPADEA